MLYNMTTEKLEDLHTQLRILILQNVRVEEEYDEVFLQEINHITQQILELKKSIKKERIDLTGINSQFAKLYNLHY